MCFACLCCISVEHFRDEGLIIKRYINLSVYFTLIFTSACVKTYQAVDLMASN